MAYDEGLAERIRDAMQGLQGIEEKKMFGGLAFMMNGNMCCGAMESDLMLRVGPEQYDSVLKMKHVKLMDFTGRPMKGLVYISSDGLQEDDELEAWLQLSYNFVTLLPEKVKAV